MILESLLEEKDSNIQDKGSESFKGISENFRKNAKGSESSTNGFKSLRRFLKQKVEKRKRFKSQQGGSESIIWENEE